MSLDDKIIDKIKKEIPNVIDEQDIRNLVQQTIEKVVLSERTKESRYSTKKLPSIIEETVQNHFEEVIRKEVRSWLNKNSEQVDKTIKEATQDGFANAVLESLDRRMESTVNRFLNADNRF